jgi:hypothetical protein
MDVFYVFAVLTIAAGIFIPLRSAFILLPVLSPAPSVSD